MGCASMIFLLSSDERQRKGAGTLVASSRSAKHSLSLLAIQLLLLMYSVVCRTSTSRADARNLDPPTEKSREQKPYLLKAAG